MNLKRIISIIILLLALAPAHIIVHECGHAFMGMLLGYDVKWISINPMNPQTYIPDIEPGLHVFLVGSAGALLSAIFYYGIILLIKPKGLEQIFAQMMLLGMVFHGFVEGLFHNWYESASDTLRITLIYYPALLLVGVYNFYKMRKQKNARN